MLLTALLFGLLLPGAFFFTWLAWACYGESRAWTEMPLAHTDAGREFEGRSWPPEPWSGGSESNERG